MSRKTGPELAAAQDIRSVANDDRARRRKTRTRRRHHGPFRRRVVRPSRPLTSWAPPTAVPSDSSWWSVILRFPRCRCCWCRGRRDLNTFRLKAKPYVFPEGTDFAVVFQFHAPPPCTTGRGTVTRSKYYNRSHVRILFTDSFVRKYVRYRVCTG